jgi:hypothetical protein
MEKIEMSNETMDAGAKSAKDLAGTRLPANNGLIRLQPTTFPELIQLAKILAVSDIVPKDLRGKEANVLLVLMFGNEIGITAAQALQNVMVVNGRPCLWGDAVMGLVLASSVYEDSKDEFNEQTMTATFRSKRKGKDWVVRTFSMLDAAKAKLDKKEGPWQEYPKRMLFHRARSWALRDSFADVLKGFRYYEEERDTINMEKTGEREYAMPTEKTAAAAAPIETTAAPAAAAAPTTKPTPETEKKPEGIIFEIQVSGAATTDFEGDPDWFAIRDRSETPIKYLTNNPEHFKLAKAAKESGAKLAGVCVEKELGKTKVRIVSALQAKN